MTYRIPFVSGMGVGAKIRRVTNPGWMIGRDSGFKLKTFAYLEGRAKAQRKLKLAPRGGCVDVWQST